MKKLLIAVGLSLAIAASAQAADKIAVMSVDGVLQEVANSSGVNKVLENEFKGRLTNLQKMETDLKGKIEKLQNDGAKMKAADRGKLEKSIQSERQTFTDQAQKFEQDHSRRTNEERSKLLSRIETALKKVTVDQKIDLVLDASNVLYKSDSVKDISSDVLKQVK